MDRLITVHAYVSGKVMSADSRTAIKLVKSVWVECKRGCYKEYTYSVNNTRIFYNMMSSAKFKVKGEKCVGGKGCKTCSAVSTCVNMTVIDKKRTYCYWKVT
jgi:TPP-dependent indolepyruvate ferredoxin oxidoreductase alpha subunit